MTSLTLSLKTAVIAGVVVTATAAALVLIANGRDGATAVAGLQTEAAQNDSVEPAGTARASEPQRTARESEPQGTARGAESQSSDGPATAAPATRPTPAPRNDGNGNSDGDGPGQGGGIGTGSFQIGGNVAGLYPGASRPLVLTFDNPASFAIRVTDLQAVAANSDDADCTRRNLVTPSEAVDVVVPRNGSSTHTVYVRMIADPHNSCQGATWTLTYSGTAVKA